MTYGIRLSLTSPSSISGSNLLKTAMGSSIGELTSTSTTDSTRIFGAPQYFSYGEFELGDPSMQNWWIPENEGLAYFYSNPDLIEEVNNLSFFNGYTIPCRITEDLSFGFESGEHWKTFLMGGTYLADTPNERQYPGVLEENVIRSDHSIRNYYIPYSKYDSNIIDYAAGGAQGEYAIEIKPSYRRHYPAYNSYAANLTSDRRIPNAYLLQTIEDGISVESEPGDLIKYIYGNVNYWRYISIEEMYPSVTAVNVYDLLDPVTVDSYLPDVYSSDPGDIGYQADDATYGTGYTSDQFEDVDYHLRNYFSSSVPRFYTLISSSVIKRVSANMRHVVFDEQARSEEMLTLQDNIHKFPMYFSIKFDSLNAAQRLARGGDSTSMPFTTVSDIISDNDYSAKFINDLKDVFAPELDTSRFVTMQNINFRANQKFSTGSMTDNYSTIYSINKTDSKSYKAIDFAEFLNFTYRVTNPNPGRNSTGTFRVGGYSEQRHALRYSGEPSWSLYNTVNAAKLINDLEELFETELQASYDIGGDPESAAQIVLRGLPYDSSPSTISRADHKHVENLAYRIEKVPFSANTIAEVPQAIQDFWIAEGSNLEEVVFYDNQVRYGVPYTYNVYAYVLVAGCKYTTTDITYSKPIGTVDESSEDYAGYHCLQWHGLDDAPANPLFEATGASALAEISTLADETQGISEDYKYMADFNLNFETSAKIIEIPIATKSCTIMDNPPNGINISPFQVLNNSQTIGFTAEYKSFSVQDSFPQVLSQEDMMHKTQYMHNLDLINIENTGLDQIDRKSISKQRFVEVYRTHEKPKSLTDFENKMISAIDLSIENSINKLSHTIFYDKIMTNKKYYYLFRFLNDSGVYGYRSDIYEVELIDDGSFKYTIIDAILEQELEVNADIYTQPSKSFKKLFMIKPSQAQMAIDTSEADFDNSSYEEVNNVNIGDPNLIDTIWDKTYKFRLTSKKTGKKIDINITYKNVTYSE